VAKHQTVGKRVLATPECAKRKPPSGRILLKGGFLYSYLVFFVTKAVGKLAVNNCVNTS